MTNRYERQELLISTDLFQPVHATVIGVGAVGRQVALQLACMGTNELTIIDPDTVELRNCVTQQYTEAQIGHLKVEALSADLVAINADILVNRIANKYHRTHPTSQIVFCCVDTISDRAHISQRLADKCNEQQVRFYCDTRMAAEAMRVISVHGEYTWGNYRQTLFAEQETFGGGCTTPTTTYAANICAGLAVARYARWQRKLHIDNDVVFNILSDECLTNASAQATEEQSHEPAHLQNSSAIS